MLYLNGDGGGVVNNVCFPSTVASTYAPAGKVRGTPLLCKPLTLNSIL